MSRFWEFVETLKSWRIDTEAVTHPLPPSTPIITVLPLVDDPEKDVELTKSQKAKFEEKPDQETNILVSIIVINVI